MIILRFRTQTPLIQVGKEMAELWQVKYTLHNLYSLVSLFPSVYILTVHCFLTFDLAFTHSSKVINCSGWSLREKLHIAK